MIIADCPGCVGGNHERHVEHWGKRPEGVIDGEFCQCKGDCAERAKATFDTWFETPGDAVYPEAAKEEIVSTRTEREHRWFEYGRWFNGFGSSMDPHRCGEDGVVCQWRERTVTTSATPWVTVTPKKEGSE